MFSKVSLVALVACVWLTATPASAETVEDRVRLTLDTTPLALINSTVRGDVVIDVGGFDEEDEYESDQVTVGIAPSFGASLGYGVGRSFVLGLRLSLTSTTTEQDALDISTASTTILVLPYVTFVGGRDEASVRFTATIMAGLGTTRMRAGGDDPRTSSGGALGASIGFLGFSAESFSLDPSLFVLYEAGSGNFGDEGSIEADFDYTGTTVGLLVSFSGWLGNKRAPTPHEERGRSARLTSAPPPPREDARVIASPARSEAKAAVLSTRTTLDSAVFMLLGAPEQRGPEVALRVQRYAPIDEAQCTSLDIELDGAVVKTIPLKQSTREEDGFQEITVQGSIDVELADRMAKARVTKLRWCGNERTLSLAAREGISSFLIDMRSRLEALPPLEAPPAAAEGQPASAPDAAPAAPPAAAPQAPPSAPALAPTPY